jgi:proteasome activator subunit 4
MLAMAIQGISSLSIHDSGPQTPIPIPYDIQSTNDRYLQKLKTYASSIPYPIEANSRMAELLDVILLRITQCVEAKDYDVGLLQWDSMLT